VGESFTLSRSVVRVNANTGAGTTLCTLPFTDRVLVGAFLTRTLFAVFHGSSPAAMSTMLLTGQSTSGTCILTYVSTKNIRSWVCVRM
jgi:hypothetical protein